MAFRALRLDDVGWRLLEDKLALNQSVPSIPKTILSQLRQADAKSVLIETDYIDRDFSEAYIAYYARTFRRHSKLCERLLFFADDASIVGEIADPAEAAVHLKSLRFLGSVVLRPISQAPLSHAILVAPPSPLGAEGNLLVRGKYVAHVLGAELEVTGVPMMQQDSRVGACAQATIWVAARHFHVKHRGPWLSTVSITKAAVANSQHAINRSLPAGSEFLTLDNMVAALRACGREPLMYAAHFDGSGAPKWGALRPAEIINRYVDSGIPVIVGLMLPGQGIGHAVIATGHVLQQTPRSDLPTNPTRAEYCDSFYVNDDQFGPNVRVGVVALNTFGEAPYTIEGNAVSLMIPLPDKVFLPAETAEAIAWSALRSYSADWDAWKTRYASEIEGSTELGDEFVSDLADNKVIARTYLTYGWKYKHRGVRNNFDIRVRKLLRSLDVPRFIYVTEFSSVKYVDHKSKYERRILAHCAIDATAKHQMLESIIMLHAPGFCSWHSHDERGHLALKVAPLPASSPYFPKIRGEDDYASFSP